MKVLDKGYVELQSVYGTEADICSAARVSSQSEKEGDEANKKLINFLMEKKHHTPFEFVCFRFKIKAPIMVWNQWTIHRISSFVLQSRRYTKVKDEFYFPDQWRLKNCDSCLPGDSAIHAMIAASYDIGLGMYEEAVNMGVVEEQARLFLPGYGVYSEGVWFVNTRSLMNFLSLRMDEHAQWEIREYANAIHDHFFSVCLPNVAEAYHKYYVRDEE